MKKNAGKQAAKPAAAPVSERKINYNYILAGILLLTWVLYYNCLNNDLLNFDDLEYFNLYPEVRDLSWAAVQKIFSFNSYYLIMYQPLPVLSFATNYHFTELSPFPLHLLNVLMHMVNVVLVFRFIRALTSKEDIAIIACLLFALHPMFVEAVSWMSARSSSMYTIFYLLALIQYVHYVQNKNVWRLILTGAFFLLSLFTKAQAVTLPVLLFAIDYYYARKLSVQMVLEKLPLLALSVLFGLITLKSPETQHNLTNGMMISYTLVDKFFLLCYSFAFYFVKLVLPIKLCAVYVYPPKTNGLLPWEYYASPLLLLAIAYALFRFRKNRLVLFGAALFFITISINIQIIPSRLFIVTDRYTYFPYIGLFLIAGYAYDVLKDKRQVFIAALAVVVIFFSWAIVDRNKVWANDEVFMTDIIEKNPDVPYLVRAYGNRGNYYMNNNMLNEAIEDFTQALRVKPGDAQTLYNRAVCYVKAGRLLEALSDLDSAQIQQPKEPLIYSNLAFVKFSMKDYDGGMQAANTCISLSQKIPEVYNTRAAIEFVRNDLDACEKDLDMAIKLKDNYADAYKNRGILYFKTNRKNLCCTDLHKAQALGQPDATGLLNMYCK